MNYRPDIDGLRAVAVLSVLLCHLGGICPGGYVGVDVFFVISGYLITGLMLKDVQAGTFSLVHFWERRIRRILPALVVVVASSFALGWFLLVPKLYEMFGRSIVSLMLLRSNLFFARHTGYFADGAEDNPLLHTWSLSVEEQFYLFIPLLFWGAMRLRRQAWLGPMVGLLAVISFACSVGGTEYWGPQGYYALSTRAWELFSGVLTALFARNLPRFPTMVRELAVSIGLASVTLPCFFYDAATPFPGLAALPPVLGSVLLIVFGASAERMTCIHRLLSTRPAVGVGLISYSLYLWHWPLMVFLQSQDDAPLTIFERASLMMGTIALAILTYRFVERPFRKGMILPTRPQLIIATATAFICLVTTGQVLRYTDGIVDRLPARAQLFARTSAEYSWWCQMHQAADVPDRLLRVGAADVEPTLLVWGDSHAGMVMPAIEQVCLASGISARCAMYPLRPPVIQHCTQGSLEAIAEANAFGDAVIKYAKSSNVSVVLLAGLWHAYFANPHFADALLQTIDELRAADRQVYFLRDIPAYKFNVAKALVFDAWRGKDLSVLSFPLNDYNVQNDFHDTFLPRLVERGVHILDPIPYLRTEPTADSISPYDNGGSLYYDQNHLSLHGTRAILPMFAPIIDGLAEPATGISSNPSNPAARRR